MWKLQTYSVSFEKEYRNKLLPGLVKRIQKWEKQDDQGNRLFPEIRLALLRDADQAKPEKTSILERLLTDKPLSAYSLANELMSQFVPGYDESDLEKNPPQPKYSCLPVLESIFDYEGQLSKAPSKYKSYWLAERIGHNTCTYCNRQYTFTVSGTNKGERIARPAFDHWYPKSRFPLLSLNLYNLIPCCTICNSGAKGDAIFNLDTHYHPYDDRNAAPKFSFRPAVSDVDSDLWRVTIDRTVGSKEDNTIKAFSLDRIYEMHGNLEVKDMMNFAQTYNGTYLSGIFKKIKEDLGHAGYTPEEVYRMIFGAESIPSKFLDRPLSKLKRDILEYLNII